MSDEPNNCHEIQLMSLPSDGKSFLIPRNRRLTWDLLHFHKTVPLCAHDRSVNLHSLVEARKNSEIRISWPAIFLKAYAIVAAQVPELRQTWYRWPWAHIYQHPGSVGILTVQREYKNAPWLFWGNISRPDQLSLLEIQRTIDRFTSSPPNAVFRDQIRMARLPTVFRRLIWSWNLNVAKARRAERLGTYFLSTLAGRGAEIQLPPSIQTGCLTYGPVGTAGLCRVTLAYDHRIMDGALVATCLETLENTLLRTVRSELLQQPPEKDIMPKVA